MTAIPNPSDTFNAVSKFTFDLKPEDIPETALRMAALLLLDTLGISAGSHGMDAGRIASDTALELYAAPEKGEGAHILFDGRRASIAGAAFAGASQIDNLDGHDGYNPTKGHIGVAVVPALIAVAEAMPDLSGRDALAALVIGYEVAGRAAISLHNTVSDYHTSGAWNAIGVAALAARLRKSDANILRHAIGIAEYHGPRSQMMREIDNPTMLHDGSGMGAMVGLSSLVMAEKGFEGAPAITIEADEVAPYWKDLGQLWTVELQYIKPYPTCRWSHAAIDCVHKLQKEHGFTANDVEHVTIRTFHEASRLFQGVPKTTSMAQYSTPFSVAALLVHGRIVAKHVSGDGLNDRAVLDLIPRIEVIEDERHNVRFPVGRWADVDVTLKDGTKLSSGDVHATGGPESPLTEDQIFEKFHHFSDPVIGKPHADAVKRAVLAMLDDNAPIGQLIEAVIKRPESV